MTRNPVGLPGAPRSLKVHEWPTVDQANWQEALRPPGKLKRGGRAAHLSAPTLDDLARRYGMFLDHLERKLGQKSLPQDEPAGSVTPEHIGTYRAELAARVGPVTQHGCIRKLRRAAELLAPGLDLQWLREIELELEDQVRPENKRHRIPNTVRLLNAGISLIESAKGGTTHPKRRAVHYRNGLMIALLSLCPIRLKNFSMLSLSTTFRKIEDTWWIILDADSTKSRRPDEREVPGILTPHLDHYVEGLRQVLQPHSEALWIGMYGETLSYSAVESVITAATKATIGVAVSPHLFRKSAASSAYLYASGKHHLASALLQHTDPRTTQEHYNKAQSASYAIAFNYLITSRQR